MRSHLLRDLSIQGKEAILQKLPEFDFYNLRRVTSFSWSGEADISSQPAALDFTFIAVYHDPHRRSVSGVRTRCSGVKRLRLPELGASFVLTEIEVEDVSTHQLEGVRFSLKDFGGSDFEVLCGNIELTITSRISSPAIPAVSL